LDEQRRLDYLEFQKVDDPRISERTIAYDDYELDNHQTFPLKYSPIMREIEEKIGKLAENKIVMDHLIDQDVVQKIENQKRERIEEKKNKEN
jgi:hypothetical protein